MNPTELAWLAGFFDGEGTVGIYRHKTNTSLGHQLRVSATNTDLPSLLKFKFAFGGYIQEMSRKGSLGKKPCWMWSTCDRLAERALQQLLPYLITKAQQARIALNFRLTYDYHRPRGGSRGRTLPEDIAVSRAGCARELSIIKR